MAAPTTEDQCFVEGLAWATDDRALRIAFRQCGDVVDCKVILDCETGRSRRFGFVAIADEKSINSAICTMNGFRLDNRSITVNQAQARSGRSHGGGGGGGGFGSRGGGRYGGDSDRYGSG
ncbi:hypothetical protein CBR_g10919 [Chara braunii]|uniref:RRM domain-containing protein n=1 Tax=Chara braunii TaxID=69332 RepID=A0A388KPJ9_CHABU|nr:hypothetical protein CBR_g10919 [Chara braunii]|eukprot:GBG71981.1 hypothetical protein CBR_g10919 [Chara braunii]